MHLVKRSMAVLLAVVLLAIGSQLPAWAESATLNIDKLCKQKEQSALLKYACNLRKENTGLKAQVAYLQHCDGQYKDNADGTVDDLCSTLQWQKTSIDQLFVWQDAGAYCDNLVLASHDDWRLPAQKELVRLVDTDTDYLIYPAFDFVNRDEPYLYNWSSTPKNWYLPNQAWVVIFSAGTAATLYGGRTDGYTTASARCVRTQDATAMAASLEQSSTYLPLISR